MLGAATPVAERISSLVSAQACVLTTYAEIGGRSLRIAYPAHALFAP